MHRVFMIIEKLIETGFYCLSHVKLMANKDQCFRTRILAQMANETKPGFSGKVTPGGCHEKITPHRIPDSTGPE